MSGVGYVFGKLNQEWRHVPENAESDAVVREVVEAVFGEGYRIELGRAIVRVALVLDAHSALDGVDVARLAKLTRSRCQRALACLKDVGWVTFVEDRVGRNGGRGTTWVMQRAAVANTAARSKRARDVLRRAGMELRSITG